MARGGGVTAFIEAATRSVRTLAARFYRATRLRLVWSRETAAQNPQAPPAVDGPALADSTESVVPPAPIGDVHANRVEAAPQHFKWMRPTTEEPRLSVEEVDSARWHFRGLLLDRLDEYFFCMRQLRSRDPGAYAMFSRVGFTIPADVLANPGTGPLETPSFAFGGILYTANEWVTSKWIYPSFLYFHKIKAPSRVEAFPGGDVYRFSVVFDSRYRGPRLTAVASCHLGVRASGEITLLREQVTTRHTIVTGTRRRRKHRRESVTLSTSTWRWPPWIEDCYGGNPQAWAADHFRIAVNTYAGTLSKVLIRVKSRDVSATFGIDVARAKYFFRDRQVTTLAADGRKKRIFHAVQHHTRQLPSLGTTEVRAHYRGLRDFRWNDYAVHIVWPANTGLLEFDKPLTYLEDLPSTTGMVDETQAGQTLAGALER